MKVKCTHSDSLECFLIACRKRCKHFYPHDYVEEDCGKIKCSFPVIPVNDARCIKIRKEEINNE